MKKNAAGIGLLLTTLLFSPVAAEEGTAPALTPKTSTEEQHEKFYLVTAYRYEPGASEGTADIGQDLCGKRCNALTADYRNYVEPRGWRIIRTAKDKEVSIDLNNSSLTGRCICVADEYIVKADKLIMVK